MPWSNGLSYDDNGRFTGQIRDMPMGNESTGGQSSAKGPVGGDPFSGTVSALVAGGLNYLGNERTNDANKQIARDATLANMSEAQKNREWEAQMSNTAVQRRMADLKSAGINPLLSGVDAASSPSGSAAQAETATMTNSMAAGLSSAIQAKQLSQAIQKQDADIALTRDQQNLTKAQTNKSNVDALATSKDLPKADLFNRLYKGAVDMFKDATRSNAQPNDAAKARAKQIHDQLEKTRIENNVRKIRNKTPF